MCRWQLRTRSLYCLDSGVALVLLCLLYEWSCKPHMLILTVNHVQPLLSQDYVLSMTMRASSWHNSDSCTNSCMSCCHFSAMVGAPAMMVSIFSDLVILNGKAGSFWSCNNDTSRLLGHGQCWCSKSFLDWNLWIFSFPSPGSFWM